MTSLVLLILVLSCRVSEILELLYTESGFFDTHTPFRPKFQGVPLREDPGVCGEQRSQTNQW